MSGNHGVMHVPFTGDLARLNVIQDQLLPQRNPGLSLFGSARVRRDWGPLSWEGENIDSTEQVGQNSLNKLKTTSTVGPSSSHDFHSQFLHGDPWECEKGAVNPSPSLTPRYLPLRRHQMQV